MLTQEYVKERFDYDHKTGRLYWKTPPKGLAVGREAGCVGNRYRVVHLKKRNWYAHKVIYLWWYGYMPESCIDHINRDRLDNRISNLREIGIVCNARNSKLSIANTSGIKGVGWDYVNNSWRVQIKVNFIKRHLGRYKDFYDAVAARLAAEQCLGWEGCDSSSTSYLCIKNYLNNKGQGKYNDKSGLLVEVGDGIELCSTL